MVIEMALKLNEKTHKRIESYKKELKEFKIFMLLLCVLFTIIALIELGIKSIWIFLIGWLILCIINGTISDLIQLIRLNKDISKKRVKKLDCTSIKPLRIKFVLDRYKHRSGSIKYIKIYYPDITLILPIKNSLYLQKPLFKSFKKTYDFNESTDKLLQVCANIKYLEKSKVIINSGLKFYKIIEECFQKKFIYTIEV